LAIFRLTYRNLHFLDSEFIEAAITILDKMRIQTLMAFEASGSKIEKP
jgi:hypothetical protein